MNSGIGVSTFKNCETVKKLDDALESCHGSQPIYTVREMNDASRQGRIDILNWWLSSGLELRYSKIAMNLALNIDVLNCDMTKAQ